MLQVVAHCWPHDASPRGLSPKSHWYLSHIHTWGESRTNVGRTGRLMKNAGPHVAGWMRLLGVPSGLAGTGLRSRIPCPADAAWVARILRSRRRRNKRCAKHASQNEGQLKIQHYLRETCQTGDEHQAASTGIYGPRSGWPRTQLDARLLKREARRSFFCFPRRISACW